MMCKNHKGTILVMTYGAILDTSLHKLHNRHSEVVSKFIIKRFRKLTYPIHNAAFDNDKVFANNIDVDNCLNVKTYISRPYTSQDKCTVEYRIVQIRRFFSKKTNLSMVTSDQVKRVERILNNKLVRKFNYKTPNQVLLEKIAIIS
jgi:IS30 family transposase